MYCLNDSSLEREFCGLKFRNPVGLAAGFDKDAKLYNSLSMIGFSFIEIGTVTPVGQSGNPSPRLFRIKNDKALLNRMGFNNYGVEAAVRGLKGKRANVIIGGNIGKNTLTANEDAHTDYLKCFQTLYPFVDYFTVNVSCPNVVNLSALQNIDSLSKILSAILEERSSQEKRKPVLVKISADINFEHLDEVLELAQRIGIDGIVAVNTTITRKTLTISGKEIERLGNGGLSGRPITERAIEIVRYINKRTQGKMPIIGVGGIMSSQDAVNMLNAGATLIQLYTGLIYEGPTLVKKICREIRR
jgi:dihydroorotate dehydrogenase